MARNALMPQMQLYDAPQGPNVGNFLNPLMAGIQRGDTLRQQGFQNERALTAEARQGEQLQLAKNADTRAGEDQAFQRDDRMRKQVGGLALAVINDPDKARAATNWQKWVAAHPQLGETLTKHGQNPADWYSSASFIAAQAGVMPDPLERRRLQAEVQGAEGRLEILPTQRQSAELDLKIKQREFDSPKIGSADLGPGHARVFYDPRTGQETGRLSAGQDPALGPFKDMKQRADVEESLRREVTSAAKEYNTIKDAAGQLDAISKAPSAVKDIAMVFSFMKILDPNSVVRETEYATAAKAAGLDDRFVNYITKIQNGQFLTPEQRQDFLGTAKTLAQSREQGYRQNIDRYRGISQRTGVDPRNVLPDEPTAPQPQAQPRQGAPAPQSRPRAHNPQTGQIIEFDGQQWREVR